LLASVFLDPTKNKTVNGPTLQGSR